MTALLAALATCYGPFAQIERKVEGLLALTSDKKLIGTIFRTFKPGSSYMEVEKQFKGERFRLFEWGKRSAILIDREDPFLRSRINEVRALEILSSKLLPDLTLNLNDLSQREKDVLTDCLAKYIPINSEALNSGSIGVGSSTAFVIHGSGGIQKGARVYESTAAERTRNNILARRPISVEMNKMSKEDADLAAQRTTDNYLQSEGVRSQCFGIAAQNLPEGLSESGKILEKELKQIALDREAASMGIALKHKLNAQSLPENSAYSALPEGVRANLEKKFLEQRRMNGFKSVEDAQAFLAGASSVDITTSISVSFSTGKSGEASIMYSFPIGGTKGAP